NYFILLEKGIAWLGGGKDWRLTLLPMAAAIAIIPLTASVALKFTGSRRTALIAAGLVAFNPYLVMWGVMIRAYSLLVALSLLAINEFFGWYQNQGWRRGIRVAGTVLLLVLTHLNGLYSVVDGRRKRLEKRFRLAQVHLAIQNTVGAFGSNGDINPGGLLAALAGHCEGEPGMGNRHSAHKRGIFAAGFSRLHGHRPCGNLVPALPH